MPSDPNLPTLNGTAGRPGRPTKRTPKIKAELLDAVASGAPFTLACDAVGLGHQTFQDWRRADPDFDAEVHQAVARATINRLREIDRQGRDGAWTALAWLCERRHPESFGRPEVQLNQQFNSSTMTVNSLTISVELADELEKRSKAINAEVDKISEAYEARRSSPRVNGTGQDQIREVESSLVVDTTITLPPPISRHPNWWAQLSKGDGHRPITVEAATYIIKTVAVDALGPQRASGVKIDLDDGSITLRDVWDALESLCGPSGWAALVKRGES
jgi:hypothetical protein